jgi:SnoaL-like domain
MHTLSCLVLWTSLFSLSTSSNTPLLCTPPLSPAYSSQVAFNSKLFHANFDKGDAGKRANGPLASISMDWTVNNEHVLGRKSFVSGLLQAADSFAGLQILDHIHLNEGNTAAILYYFQGTNSAPYNGHPTSHAKVEAWNGEFLLFDSSVLLNQLITINEFDSFELQVTGQQNVTSFTPVSLVENPQTAVAFREKIKNTAAKFTQLFNARTVSEARSLCTNNVVVRTSKGTSTGFSAVAALLNRYQTPFPDLLVHDEYIIADGHFAAVESIIEGSRTGPFTVSNGTVVPADGETYRTRVMRWYQFTDGGNVEGIWEVNNRDDLLENMLG